MRICFTGTHGCGKTTILTALKEKLPGYTIQVESLTRKAVDDSSKLNLTTPNDSELKIATLYFQEFLRAPKNYISARHLIDVLAYSTYLQEVNGNILKSTFGYIDNKLIQIIKKKIFNLVFYIPIEFEQKEGGEFREGQQENPGYQKRVDELVKYYLNYYCIKYTTITGNVSERVDKVLTTIINWYV
jgi:predicted ATPase